MLKNDKWKMVEEVTDWEQLPPNNYICVIKNAYASNAKITGAEMLVLELDVDEGKCKGYFQGEFDRSTWMPKKWSNSAIIRKLTGTDTGDENTQKWFKQLITSIEKSNPRYNFEKQKFDEKTLIGKLVVGQFGEEEYIPNQGKYAGQVRTRVVLNGLRSIDAYNSGNLPIPTKKYLSVQTNTAQTPVNNYANEVPSFE